VTSTSNPPTGPVTMTVMVLFSGISLLKLLCVVGVKVSLPDELTSGPSFVPSSEVMNTWYVVKEPSRESPESSPPFCTVME